MKIRFAKFGQLQETKQTDIFAVINQFVNVAKSHAARTFLLFLGSQTASKLRRRNLISAIRPIRSTLIRHETELFVWTGKFLKTELFENDSITIVMRFSQWRFPQTEI